MREIRQRVANIIRFVSMIGVVASLVFMYAYGMDGHTVEVKKESWLDTVDRSTLFYYGLGIFAIFNFIMNWGIRVYRDAQGNMDGSIFFKSESHKAGIVFWLTLLLATINFFIALIITYIGFMRIQGEEVGSTYFALPLLGLILLLTAVIGLVYAIFRKNTVSG
jgi:fatty acid desaturase